MKSRSSVRVSDILYPSTVCIYYTYFCCISTRADLRRSPIYTVPLPLIYPSHYVACTPSSISALVFLYYSTLCLSQGEKVIKVIVMETAEKVSDCMWHSLHI